MGKGVGLLAAKWHVKISCMSLVFWNNKSIEKSKSVFFCCGQSILIQYKLRIGKKDRWLMDRWLVGGYSVANLWWFSNMTNIWRSIATEGQIYVSGCRTLTISLPHSLLDLLLHSALFPRLDHMLPWYWLRASPRWPVHVDGWQMM